MPPPNPKFCGFAKVGDGRRVTSANSSKSKEVACSLLLLQACILVTLLGLLHCSEARQLPTNMLAEFLMRTEDQWRKMWHSDCHRRCRHELDVQIRLACDKDIYRIKRSPHETKPNISSILRAQNHVIDKRSASTFLSSTTSHMIRRKKGIMEECCYAKSCTWEEYAESCHHHGRSAAKGANKCGK